MANGNLPKHEERAWEDIVRHEWWQAIKAKAGDAVGWVAVAAVVAVLALYAEGGPWASDGPAGPEQSPPPAIVPVDTVPSITQSPALPPTTGSAG